MARTLGDAADTRLLTAYGTLYRARGRLEKMGLVKSRWEDPDVPASENRPGRRLYTLTALGETEAALKIWQQVTEGHSYPRAKVQLAELYLAKNQPELARAELKDIVSDDQHAPAFQRKRDRVWVRRAKSLMHKL